MDFKLNILALFNITILSAFSAQASEQATDAPRTPVKVGTAHIIPQAPKKATAVSLMPYSPVKIRLASPIAITTPTSPAAKRKNSSPASHLGQRGAQTLNQTLLLAQLDGLFGDLQRVYKTAPRDSQTHAQELALLAKISGVCKREVKRSRTE